MAIRRASHYALRSGATAIRCPLCCAPAQSYWFTHALVKRCEAVGVGRRGTDPDRPFRWRPPAEFQRQEAREKLYEPLPPRRHTNAGETGPARPPYVAHTGSKQE